MRCGPERGWPSSGPTSANEKWRSNWLWSQTRLESGVHRKVWRSTRPISAASTVGCHTERVRGTARIRAMESEPVVGLGLIANQCAPKGVVFEPSTFRHRAVVYWPDVAFGARSEQVRFLSARPSRCSLVVRRVFREHEFASSILAISTIMLVERKRIAARLWTAC
jgi:hypothetical protein